MFCREIDPDTDCPGMLRADRHRTRPGTRTRAWRCAVCGQRFFRCKFTGRIVEGLAASAEERARRIREHVAHAQDAADS